MTSTTSCALTGLTNGVAYTILAQAWSSAGWSAESDTIAASPEAPVTPSIVITAMTRTAMGRHDRIAVTGTVVGLVEGQMLSPYLQIDGHRVKKVGNARVPVRSDGTIRWQRKVRLHRDVTVYFEINGVQSNAVTWQRVR